MITFKFMLLALAALFGAAICAAPGPDLTISTPPTAATNVGVLQPEVTDVSDTLLTVLKGVKGRMHKWDDGKINYACKWEFVLNGWDISDIEMFDVEYEDVCNPLFAPA
jgi:hypothetical protein